MKSDSNWLRHRSIKVSLLLLLTFITTAAVVSLTWIAVSSTESQGRSAQQISSEALITQARDYLLQLTVSSAKENDLLLKQVKNDAQQLAEYAAAVFENSAAFNTSNYWEATARLFEGPYGQHLNSPEDISSVFVPNHQELSTEVIRDIELSAYLDLVFEGILANHPETEAIYFATHRDVVRYYPNVNLGMVVPPNFKATERVWFAGSLLQNNPEGLAWWTPPYLDATGLGLVTTAAAPAYTKDHKLVGVVGFDVTLNEMVNRIEATRVLKSGYSFLIDGSGKAIALPPQGYSHILGRPQGMDEINIDLTKSTTGFAGIIARMIRGGRGVESLVSDGEELFIAYAPLPGTGWSLGSVVESREVIQSVSILQEELEHNTNFLLLNRVLPVSLAIFILVIFLGLIITNRITHPIQQLAVAAQKILDGQWDVELPTHDKNEIGLLAHTFQEMIYQIHRMVRDLEQRVNERTRELEMRSNQLQVAAEIARDATAIRELDILLNRTVNLVKERFGLYSAGIFLLDDKKEYACLRAATGAAGKTLLTTGHKLKVGEEGIVGFVCGSGKPHISQEAGLNTFPSTYPEQPAARSEMALPLTVENQVIGALAVQSDLPAAFTEEDIRIYQHLADQLAVAIENVRLYQESQENLSKLQTMYDSYSQEAWKRIEKSKRVMGFRYEPTGITPLLRENGIRQGRLDEKEGENGLVIPLVVRGKTIGELEVWPQKNDLTREDTFLIKAVGERISQALESARLFEESKARTAREKTLNLMSASFSHSLDFETLLKTAVIEMGRLPNVAEVTVHIGQPENGKSENDRVDNSLPTGDEDPEENQLC